MRADNPKVMISIIVLSLVVMALPLIVYTLALALFAGWVWLTWVWFKSCYNPIRLAGFLAGVALCIPVNYVLPPSLTPLSLTAPPSWMEILSYQTATYMIRIASFVLPVFLITGLIKTIEGAALVCGLSILYARLGWWKLRRAWAGFKASWADFIDSGRPEAKRKAHHSKRENNKRQHGGTKDQKQQRARTDQKSTGDKDSDFEFDEFAFDPSEFSKEKAEKLRRLKELATRNPNKHEAESAARKFRKMTGKEQPKAQPPMTEKEKEDLEAFLSFSSPPPEVK